MCTTQPRNAQHTYKSEVFLAVPTHHSFALVDCSLFLSGGGNDVREWVASLSHSPSLQTAAAPPKRLTHPHTHTLTCKVIGWRLPSPSVVMFDSRSLFFSHKPLGKPLCGAQTSLAQPHKEQEGRLCRSLVENRLLPSSSSGISAVSLSQHT